MGIVHDFIPRGRFGGESEAYPGTLTGVRGYRYGTSDYFLFGIITKPTQIPTQALMVKVLLRANLSGDILGPSAFPAGSVGRFKDLAGYTATEFTKDDLVGWWDNYTDVWPLELPQGRIFDITIEKVEFKQYTKFEDYSFTGYMAGSWGWEVGHDPVDAFRYPPDNPGYNYKLIFAARPGSFLAI